VQRTRRPAALAGSVSPVVDLTVARPTLVVLSRRGRDSLTTATWDELERVADVRVVQRDSAPDPREAERLLRDADLLGATNLCLPRLDDALLQRLPRLSGVVLYATGFDLLDVAVLERHGVGLSVLPEYATKAVAEQALALLLTLATRLHLAHDRSRGRGNPDVSLRGVELHGRTLGVLGVGRIGGRVAQLAQAFGMRVLGYDVDPAAAARARAGGVEIVDLATLLRGSDALALCASSTFGAPPVLGRVQVAALRPGALLVNVARPALVDTAAVTAALRRGALAGYAVDDVVLDEVADADLLEQGRVVQTGHSAWWRDEVLERGGRMWGEHLLAAALGQPLDVVTWPRLDAPLQRTSRRKVSV
jgi:phosphoglycerate dehydrogenase-like enzyme